jgi:(1->4)-alpha-D-glucan 1-alpha-D-glucosylmutase
MAELRCTYRLMFSEAFRFADARALIGYLRDLGVSHVYLPPSFQARAGSTHGYDVVDPGSISEELGGEDEFRALCRDARAAGLGVVLDIVPNHMAADDANRFWADEQLRRKYFDVDEETGFHRRFFDIDHLAGVRMEDPEVFEETHRLALSLVRDGTIDGLRIDHPDGLADPAGYLRRLADAGAGHVWVEKILDPGERLRADWPVDGTVGYEFLNDAAALFVDPRAEEDFTALWAEVSGDARPFGAYAEEAKLQQASTTFTREVDRLRRAASGDVPALEEALSALPVYRTYVRGGEASEEDLAVLREAGVEWVLEQPEEFVTRFQQTTPPVMAKGVEDTAFYRYLRLLAVNDVGGDPSRFGMSVADFHAAGAERQRSHPRNLLITQTHDTKRSGDVRARIGALTAMPERWAAFTREWLPRLGFADPVEGYLVLQTLAGAWPIDEERLLGYLEKALRERKVTTNWIEPDEAHEAGVRDAARAALGDDAFLAALEDLLGDLRPVGDRHALAQTLLKLTVPGVPDIYQGDEMESLFLVDPDNRRPVDYDRRRLLLDDLRGGHAPTEETRKLWLIHRVLELRARRADAFTGDYTPLDAPPDTCAFTRGGDVLVAVAVREGWGAPPALPPDQWRDALDGVLTWQQDGILLRERA